MCYQVTWVNYWKIEDKPVCITMITMNHYDSKLALWNGCYDKVGPQTMKRLYKKGEIWQFQNSFRQLEFYSLKNVSPREK